MEKEIWKFQPLSYQASKKGFGFNCSYLSILITTQIHQIQSVFWSVKGVKAAGTGMDRGKK
jgi:hypothetical protein